MSELSRRESRDDGPKWLLGGHRGPKMPRAVAMRPQARTARAFVPIVAILIAMLTGGSGLAGLVRVLGPAHAHVCTCASGGSHAACPVCNPSLAESPAVDGVPCGGQRSACVVASDPVTLRVTPTVVEPPAVRQSVASTPRRQLEDVSLEPKIPPPRASRA
jgi:hypothetical protein